jgi:hypothetical protein
VRPTRKHHCARLTTAMMLWLSIMGFPGFLFAEENSHQAVGSEVGNAKMPQTKSTRMIGGDHTSETRTSRDTQRKQIPLRIPAGTAELLRLKSRPATGDQAQPIVPPAC